MHRVIVKSEELHGLKPILEDRHHALPSEEVDMSAFKKVPRHGAGLIGEWDTQSAGALACPVKGHAVMSVKVRPKPKDSGFEAREAPWRESKTAEPSDNMLERSVREASGCNVQ
jgi:hypothetical protein